MRHPFFDPTLMRGPRTTARSKPGFLLQRRSPSNADSKLRQTADPLTPAANAGASRRIPVATRVFPFEPQSFDGEPPPDTSVLFMPALAGNARWSCKPRRHRIRRSSPEGQVER
jgi:hypothetical protein